MSKKPKTETVVGGQCIGCRRELRLHLKDPPREALKRKGWSNVPPKPPKGMIATGHLPELPQIWDAPQMSEVVWITRDGRSLTMDQIGDTHLLNIVRMLERRALTALLDGYSVTSCLQGEMAIEVAESAITAEYEKLQERISEFRGEAAARGLDEGEDPL